MVEHGLELLLTGNERQVRTKVKSAMVGTISLTLLVGKRTSHVLVHGGRVKCQMLRNMAWHCVGSVLGTSLQGDADRSDRDT